MAVKNYKDSIDKLNKIYNKNNLNKIDSELKTYNCFGFVSYVLGWTNKLFWLEDDFTHSLEYHTNIIQENEELKEGDILILYYKTKAIHSAILVNKNSQDKIINEYLFIHKKGRQELISDTLDDILEIYDELYDRIEFRRMNNNNNK